MKILIDADGCPVVRNTIRVGEKFAVPCWIICDTSHNFSSSGAERIITVSKGADSADFTLVNAVQPGDVVVTQDYGLAAMCLSKQGVPIHQDGFVYDERNMDGLLMSRYLAKSIRRSGGRLKGPSKRSKRQDDAFEQTLSKILTELTQK